MTAIMSDPNDASRSVNSSGPVLPRDGEDGPLQGSGRGVEVVASDDVLGLDGGDLGRGERGGPEVGDAADSDDEQPAPAAGRGLVAVGVAGHPFQCHVRQRSP